MKKPIVVAGNAPSLREIDYTRLPEAFDVFRCTQFFFEDKYYLGKEVTGFFLGYDALFDSSIILEKRKEYFFQDRYFKLLLLNIPELEKRFRHLAPPSTLIASDFCGNNPTINKFLVENYLVFGLYPTTGLLMILTAIALGYQEIYVTGIDFYSQSEIYAFPIEQAKALNTLVSNFSSPFGTTWHSLVYEQEILEFTKTFAGVTLYSLSPNSLLSEHYPLAPVQNNNPYNPITKPEGYLQDIVFIKKPGHTGLSQKIKTWFLTRGLQVEWDFLREYWLIKFCYQGIRFLTIGLKVMIKLFTK
ncbi:MAG: alpha-2,3-sialyltransferase [Brevinema sp.]